MEGAEASEEAGPVIVQATPRGLLLITQPDHAALSGAIMAAWTADGLPSRPTRDSVLLAARAHDDGWRPVDAEPVLDPRTARPCDFIHIDDRVKHAIWPAVLAQLSVEDTYAAALVAEHALTVHGRHRGNPAWHGFFEEITATRDDLLGRQDRSATDVTFVRDYRVVFLGDLVSLIFCNGWTDPFTAHGYRLRLQGRILQVHPDPFAGAPIAVEVPACLIPSHDYASDRELRAAVSAGERTRLTGHVAGTHD